MILVLHEQNDFLIMVNDVLRASNHLTARASNLREAREILEIGIPAAVIIWGDSPTGDGVRFHSFVRDFSDHPEIPFFFVLELDEVADGDLALNDFYIPSSNGAIAAADMLEQTLPQFA